MADAGAALLTRVGRRRRLLARAAAVAAIGGAAGAVAAVAAVNPGSPCGDVDYAAFRAADEFDRQGIATRIDSCGALEGRSRADVRALLGPPAWRGPATAADGWFVGPSGFFHDGVMLSVAYGPGRTVTGTELRTT